MLGLHQWVPRKHHAEVGLGVGLVTFAIAAMLPFASILPAYAQPEALELYEVPEAARVEPVPVGNVAQVVGWELEQQTIEPDNDDAYVDAVVYWQATSPDGGDYVSFAHLLGREHELVGEINRRPACGMVPTDFWEPGEVWRDPYRIPVAEDARAPSHLRVEVGLYDPEAEDTLGLVRIGDAKLAPPELATDPNHPLDVRLADGVTLSGYDLAPANVKAGEMLTVTLYWKAWAPPSKDYQVFIHMLGDDVEPLIQGDGPPLEGDYPTSLWEAGEVIADPHPMALPAGTPTGQYRLLVGMYDLSTMERLSRSDGGGTSIEIPLTVDDD